MSEPTPEQKAVLDSKARIRIVRAVPGSGKTWVVAELIKKELASWKTQHQGIAALSFTRVGGQEIHRAIGYDLNYPHFVGTLDAFIFRFVVRPYLTKAFPAIAPPRLIPAEWKPHEWSYVATNTKTNVILGEGTNRRYYNIFRAYFLGEKDGSDGSRTPIIGYKHPGSERLTPLDDVAHNAVLQAKREMFKTLGWLTHSDASILASKILDHTTYGPIIRNEILRRFPFIVVDELQDTGWFLGTCVLQLLSEPSARGALVGDPDQAIFEFNGARPDLFDRFNTLAGAKELALGKTLRCVSAVVTAAVHLASPNRRIEPAPSRTGRAFLLTYKNMESDIGLLRSRLANLAAHKVVRIITRLNKTIQNISGHSVKFVDKLGSVPLNHLHRAVNSLRGGRQAAALAAARAAIEQATLGREGFTDEELAAKSIEPTAWKRFCIDVLLEANREVPDETFGLWGMRMSAHIQKGLAVFPLANETTLTASIRQPHKKAKQLRRNDYITRAKEHQSKDNEVPVQTVHAVKGQTHDLTVFVCPEPKRADRCPSVLWWPDKGTDSEERRIAFVAVTRTQGDLIVCVSEGCLSRLRAKQSSFVNAFECMSVQEYISGRKFSPELSTRTIDLQNTSSSSATV